MWLASPPPQNSTSKARPTEIFDPEEILDRMLGLSPFVSLGPNGEILANLGGLLRYWRLDTLTGPPRDVADRPQETARFLSELKSLEGRFGLHFVVAPTAPWACWICAHGTAGLPLFIDRVRLQSLFALAPSESAAELIPDVLAKAEGRAAFLDFCERTAELGWRRLGDVEAASRDPDARDGLLSRFGGVFEKILRRLQGADDFRLKAYEPPMELERTIWLARETGTADDPMGEVQASLDSWAERLAARRALLKGLEVSFRGERSKRTLVFRLPLPKPTRDVASLLRLVEEKWHGLSDPLAPKDEAFADAPDMIRLRSLGLDNESDRQLDLFRPGREENLESWNLLVARLLSRATHKKPLSVGRWRPFESWLPERSVEWVDWGEAESLPVVRDPPTRPLVTYAQPQTLAKAFAGAPKLRSEEDFLDWLETRDALGTLERVREELQERSYARVGAGGGVDFWVFWDHARGAAFVQGAFENAEAVLKLQLPGELETATEVQHARIGHG